MDNKKIITQGALINTLNEHQDDVNSVSHDNKKIISGSDDHSIKIWDLETGNLINTLNGSAVWNCEHKSKSGGIPMGHQHSVSSVCLSNYNDNLIQKLLKIELLFDREY